MSRNKKNISAILLFFLVFVIGPVFAQPANDDPCSAIALPVGTNCVYTQYTNVAATNSPGVPAPGCGNYQGGDVWFSAVVPANGQIIFDSNTGVMLNGAMAAYSGPCGSLSLIACNNNGSANGLMPALNLTGLTPGSTIYIRFWGVGAANFGTFSICARSVVPCNPANINSSCASADPFCAGATTNLCNTTNVSSLGSGGIYGCLGSTPNPAFYFMNIATSGPIDLQISQQTTAGVGIDVDFVAWGPFASQAAMCAGLSAGNIIDCSYSTAAIENMSIPNAIAGQWYMLLITNFSNLAGVIMIDQTNAGDPGAGSTDCNLITAIPGPCTGSTFTLTGTVQAASVPVSGTLTITTSCGGSVVYNAPFTSPISYSIPGISGCAQNCTVNAVFSAIGSPTILPASFTSTNCNTLTAIPGPCSGGTYILSGTVVTACAPASGTLTITSSCGGSTVLNAPFGNPINWSLPPSNGNGGNCTITAVFSASGAPVISPIIITEPNCCGTNTGTQTITVTNGTLNTLANGMQQVLLCPSGTVVINSNNNFTLPAAGCLGCTPGLMYGIYSSAGPTGPDPNVDPNWTGYYWTGANFPGTNTQGLNTNTLGSCSPLFTFPTVPGYSSMNPLNNTFVFVPITADAANLPNHDNNLDGCFSIGTGISVSYLNPITFNSLSSCGGTMTIEINGGSPEFFPGTYTLVNTGAGSLNTTVVSSGGNVVVSGLVSGQTVSFTVTDGNGCTAVFSKVFNNIPLPTVNVLPSNPTVCVGDCVTLMAGIIPNVPAGNSTFTNNNCKVIPDGGILTGNNGQVNTGTWVMSPINISDYCGVNWTTGQLIQVCINITHTWVSDLNIFLQAPNGVLLSLSSDDGGGGDNFITTCFTGTAANIIGTAGNNTAPFNGTYAPDGPGGFPVFNGTSVNGIWRLWVADDAAADAGTLNWWSITFANQNTYTYTWSPVLGLSATNILNPDACPISTTTYTVTATNSCGCSASSSTTVTVNPIPTASISGTTSICSGNSTNITFTGTPNATVTYTINGGANQTIVLNGAGSATLNTGALITNTTYALINAFFPGPPVCSQSISGSAVITVVPSIATFTYATPFCQNGTNPLPTFVGGGVAGVFSSTAGLNFINTATGEINLITSIPGTYTITNTIAAAGGCPQVTATFDITIHPQPNAGSNGSVTLCASDPPINLFSSLGGTPMPSGNWSGPSVLGGGNLGIYTPGTSLPGIYTYTVAGIAPCANSSANVTVNQNAVVIPTFNAIPAYCVGDVPVILASVSNNGISGTWSPATISTATAGTTVYTFTPNAGQCGSSVVINILINSVPNVTPVFHD